MDKVEQQDAIVEVMDQFEEVKLSEPQSSLTDPSARTKPLSLSKEPPLSEEETTIAVATLSDPTYAKQPLFRRSERCYNDPSIPGQNVVLISFIPSQGARPNKYGIYGYAKVRGTFPNLEASEVHATDLIKNHDSVHSIKHVMVGQPFPLTLSSDFTEQTNTVYRDINKVAKEDISKFIRQEGEKDKRTIEEIHQREQQLKEDAARPLKLNEDEMDQNELNEKYLILRKGLAMCVHQYKLVCDQHLKLLADQARKKLETINGMEARHPSIVDSYMKLYNKSMEESGIDTKTDDMARFIQKCIGSKPNLEALPNLGNIEFF